MNYCGCFIYFIWNGPANSMSILNEYCPIHLIHLSLRNIIPILSLVDFE